MNRTEVLPNRYRTILCVPERGLPARHRNRTCSVVAGGEPPRLVKGHWYLKPARPRLRCLCQEGDLNPHVLRHTVLNRACLPFQHPGIAGRYHSAIRARLILYQTNLFNLYFHTTNTQFVLL